MKFIHIADVHLGAKPDKGRVWSEARTEEIEESFKEILKVCDEQQVDLLLIAGDLFDSQPEMKQLKNVDYLFSRMRYTKTVIIAGDHDYIESGASWNNYNFNSNTVVFPREKAASIYFEDINVSVTGYSYGCAEHKERILEKLKPGREGAYNILLGHGGDPNHMPFSRERIAQNGFDYIALGHIHKPTHILKDKMTFAGSLEPIAYNETGKHGYIMGEVNGEGKTNITFVPFSKRRYINMTLELSVDYSNAEIMDAVSEQIKAKGKDNIYRILLKGIVDNNLEINLSSLMRQYNIYEIINKTEFSYDIDELFDVNEHNLLGRFVSKLRDDENTTEDIESREKALKYGIEAILGIEE